MNRWQSMSAVVLVASISPVAMGQIKPTLWAGGPVSSATTTHCDIVQMFVGLTPRTIVRSGTEAAQYASALNDGIAAADAACDDIQTAAATRVGLVMNGFGQGGLYGYNSDLTYWDAAPSLVYHPADRLASCSGVTGFLPTPWTDHAVAECSAWMKGFCTQYRARQIDAIKTSSTPIPDPEILAFDCENVPNMGNTLNDSVTIWSAFMGCLMADHRSGADASYVSQWRYLPGNQLGERKTLAQSYRDARVRYDGHSTDTTLPLTSGGDPDPAAITTSSAAEIKWLFATWINGMYTTVRTQVLDLAVRHVLDGYFPACKFSNFTDSTGDGLVDAARPPYVYNSPFNAHYNCGSVLLQGTSGYRLCYETSGGWGNIAVNNLGNTDAPCFYGFGSCSGWVTSPEVYRDEFFRFFNGQLDAINFSSGGTRRGHVIPYLAGIPFMTDSGVTIDANWHRDLFALGRAKGVRDYMYFQPTPTLSIGDKAILDASMGDAWAATIGCVTPNMGTILTTTDNAKALAETDANMLDVSSIYFYGSYCSNFYVKFKVPTGYSPDKIKIVIETNVTFDDASTPSGTDDVVIAIRPYRTTDSTFFGHFANVWGGTTPSPAWNFLVADPGSDFVVPASTSGVCSSTGGDEIWVLVSAQTQGGHTPKEFTLHVDHLHVYGYK